VKKQISRGFKSETQSQTYRLIEIDNEFCRYLRAGNPKLSKSSMYKFALDGCHRIRCRVAECAEIPNQLLYRLAADSHPDVRISAGENRRAPQRLMERLSSDQDVDVRHALAENAHTPRFILHKLAQDENPFVSYRATKTINISLLGTIKRTTDLILLRIPSNNLNDVNQSTVVER
jgi:hypothetical protein